MLFQTIGAFRLIFKKLSSTKKHSNFTDAVLSMMYRLMYGVWCISWCMVYGVQAGVWCIGWCMVYKLVYGV